MHIHKIILKQQEAPWDFVYTPSRIYTCFLLHVHVYLDFADKKSRIICFSGSTITDNFRYLNDAKCRPNIFKISTQNVTQAVPVNANVNCYCIIWIVQKFLARIKHWVEFVIS